MWTNFEQCPVEDLTLSNEYSSRSIFKIGSDDAVTSLPTLQAYTQETKTVVAINKSLLLLEGELVSECSCLSFNADIDVLAITYSGNMSICGLNDGEIHGIYNKGLPVFNVCIKAEDVSNSGKTFVAVQHIGKHYYFTCTNGSVYRLSELDEAQLECSINTSALVANDTEGANKTLLNEVSITKLFANSGVSRLTAALLLSFPAAWNSVDCDIEQETFLLIGSTANKLYFRHQSEEPTVMRFPERFLGLKRVYNVGNLIIALTNSGHLLNICPFTYTTCLHIGKVNTDFLIDDMIIMQNSEQLELQVLTKSTVDKSRVIKILEYPSLKCCSELDVPEHSWLVRQPQCSINLYHMSGENVNQLGLPIEVEMVLVSETHPAERFKKLINRGHLDEAEEFGLQFELCMQPLYEAKAKRILLELSNPIDVMQASDDCEAKFEAFLQLLTKIEDNAFIKNNRLISMPSKDTLERYLLIVLQRLNSETDEAHILEINEQLLRLKTLSIIDPDEIERDWQSFVYHSNLLKVVASLLKKDVPAACIVWKRHFSCMSAYLNNEKLYKVLTLIPINTEPFFMVQWVRQFVTTVYHTHASVMPYIADWCIEKTRSLQYSDHWPEIGLEFATKILSIFEELKYAYADIRRQHEHNITTLHELVNSLQDLSVLKTTYNLLFTLDNYSQISKVDTALSILQRIHADKLQSVVNDFLMPIFQEKGDTPVAAIREYLVKLVANRSSLSNWLQRAVICIDLLHDEDDRMEFALLVLQNAPVPWPEAVAPLIKLRTSSHPLACKINTEIQMESIKIMMGKYGWVVNSSAVNHLQLFMMRIVKVKLPTMLKDIQVLTKAAPNIAAKANFYCCYQMVLDGQIDEAYDFFSGLEAEHDDECIAQVVNIFANILECNSEPLETDEAIQQRAELFEFYKLIVKQRKKPKDLERCAAIERCFLLQQRYNLIVDSVSDLQPLRKRVELLDQGVDNVIEKARTVTSDLSSFFQREIGQLCAALQLEKVRGIYLVARRLNCLSLSCALAYYIREHVECTKQRKDDFIALGLELLVQQMSMANSKHGSDSEMQNLTEHDPLAFPLAYNLLSAALPYDEYQHGELIELIKYVRVAAFTYPFKVIEAYYDGREQQINELIVKELRAADAASQADSTMDFSTELNESFDAKPTSKSNAGVSKRWSVSVFDNVEVKTNDTRTVPHVNTRLPAVMFVARTLLLLAVEPSQSNAKFVQMANALSEQIKSDIDSAQDDFFLSLGKLIGAREHRVWYIIVQYLLDYQSKNDCKAIINADLVSLQLRRFFRNCLSLKNLDLIGIVSMLVADGHAGDILEKLSSDVKTDQQKLNFLALSEKYYVYRNEKGHAESLREMRLKHYYYIEFCKKDPGLKGRFNAELDSIEQLLKECNQQLMDVRLLRCMSLDFGFDYEKMLITQILAILGAQELQYKTKLDAFGDEQLVVLTKPERIKSLCQPYVNEIENKDALANRLKKFIDEINIYFYELYLCVIDLLVYLERSPPEMQIWSNMLHFLRHKMITRRRNRAGQLENDIWLQSQTEIGVLPKIARYRLPFKPLVEKPLKDLLDGELTVDNCEGWFPLIQMHIALKNSKNMAHGCDYFCMTAVKNSISEYKIRNETETWHLLPTNDAFLKSILRLVKHVHSQAKVFLILYFVLCYAPDGADQVEAAYECWKHAQEHDQDLANDPKCQDLLTKIKRKYPTLKTQQFLHLYNMAEEKLLRLAEHAEELISSLYHHELTLKFSKIDINSLVADISELHELDVETLQFKLLQKWLSFTMEQSDGTILDDTYADECNGSGNADDRPGSATEHVIRANYILNSWPKMKAAQFLVAHIFNKEGVLNTAKQLQMYECFSKLNDGSKPFSNVIDQQQYLTVKCVHELKALGYNITMEKFVDAKCSKIDILKKIWQQYSQKPQALEVIANLCLAFEINLSKIWNGILKRMISFKMERELNVLVDILSGKAQLVHVEGLALAWDFVIRYPLKNADKSRTALQQQALNRVLWRLQGCPVAHSINLLQFAEQCILIERPHMAAIAMVFCLEPNTRQKIKNLITTQHNTSNLRKEITELEEVGIFSIIINTALKELDL